MVTRLVWWILAFGVFAASAEAQLATAPGRVVFFWYDTEIPSETSRTLTVWGDGKAVLALESPEERGERQLRLPPEAMSELVALIEGHGLAAWDGERLAHSTGLLDQKALQPTPTRRTRIFFSPHQKRPGQPEPNKGFARDFRATGTPIGRWRLYQQRLCCL